MAYLPAVLCSLIKDSAAKLNVGDISFFATIHGLKLTAGGVGISVLIMAIAADCCCTGTTVCEGDFIGWVSSRVNITKRWVTAQICLRTVRVIISKSICAGALIADSRFIEDGVFLHRWVNWNYFCGRCGSHRYWFGSLVSGCLRY